jgi:hypothetical protein
MGVGDEQDVAREHWRQAAPQMGAGERRAPGIKRNSLAS